MRIAVQIDYWTEFVGTFDPGKVVWLVKRAFPETVADPTDYQAVRLNRELAHFGKDPERHAAVIRQAIRNAQDNGPTFRFEIPTDAGPIKGQARRYSVTLDMPDGIGDDLRDRMEAFLKGLNLGAIKLDS